MRASIPVNDYESVREIACLADWVYRDMWRMVYRHCGWHWRGIIESRGEHARPSDFPHFLDWESRY